MEQRRFKLALGWRAWVVVFEKHAQAVQAALPRRLHGEKHGLHINADDFWLLGTSFDNHANLWERPCLENEHCSYRAAISKNTNVVTYPFLSRNRTFPVHEIQRSIWILRGSGDKTL